MIRFLQRKGQLQKYLLGGFLVVVCISMLVYLIPGFMGSGGSSVGSDPNVLAKVGSEEITVDQVTRLARNMLRQQYGDRIPAEQAMPFFRPRALQVLVNRAALALEANRMGLDATDDELRYELEHGHYGPLFFPEGKFIGQEAYKGVIAQNFEMSVQEFEANTKRDICIRKVIAVLGSGATVTEDEVKQAFLRTQTQVKFDYAVLSLAQLTKLAQVSDAELHAFYEKNQAQFANMIPERRKARYVLVDAQSLPNPPKATEMDLQSYYRAHQAEYRTPEQVTVRHILIKTPLPGADGKVDQKAMDAARTKAQDVLKQLKAGGDFGALAKKFSDNPATADKGGLVGQLVRGSGTAPDIERVAFTLNKGQTSDLISTSYGFEIIRVDDRTPAHQKTLEELRGVIEPIVQRDIAQRAVEQFAHGLESSAHGDGLEKAAAAKGVKVVTTDFLAQGEPVPALGPVAAFSDALFKNNVKAPPVAVQVPQGFVVLETAEIKPPSTPSFEQVKDRLAQYLKSQKAQAMLQQKTVELSEKARASHDLKAAAKATGASFYSSDFVLPGGQVPELGQLSGPAEVVFDMKPGEVSTPILSGSSGVVIALRERQAPAADELVGLRDQIRESLLETKREEAEQLFLGSLRERMEKSGKLRVDEKRLAALSGQRQ